MEFAYTPRLGRAEAIGPVTLAEKIMPFEVECEA